MIVFVVAAVLMLALAGKLLQLATQSVWLHRHGTRTSGAVDRLWVDDDRDGPPQMRAMIGYDFPENHRGSIHVPARRGRGSVYVVGDRVPVVYDPRRPSNAYVVPEGSPRLLVSAGVWGAIAVGAVAFAVVMVGIGVGTT